MNSEESKDIKMETLENKIKHIFETTNRADRRKMFKPWKFKKPTTIIEKLMNLGKR